MPQSVFFFLSLTRDVTESSDPMWTGYPDSLSAKLARQPHPQRHTGNQLTSFQHWDTLQSDLRIPSRSQLSTAVLLQTSLNNADTGISSSWQLAGFFHRNAMHLLFYFEIKTNVSRLLSFKILPENYSIHTTIALFFKNHFCSFGHFKWLSCVQVQ